MSTRWATIAAAIIIVGITTAVFADHFQREVIDVRIGDDYFRALVADSLGERIRGLSGLPSLGDDTVMLFIFPHEGRHGIWMRNMKFSIDILWLDSEQQVIDIQEFAAPESFPHVFRPDGFAKYVIEMNAGDVKRLGIQEGERLFIGR